METLIASLRSLEADDYIERDDILDDYDVVRDIRNQLEALLIPVDWERILHLRRYGYRVFPFEYDSWGWLIGAVQTKKGIILFG